MANARNCEVGTTTRHWKFCTQVDHKHTYALNVKSCSYTKSYRKSRVLRLYPTNLP
jgi:predicted nucleic-acid-binding Zn-ribbon protein